MSERILYTKPSITEREVELATDAARNGWGDRCYEYIQRFEQNFASHLCVKHAIATSSCTGALHMGLAALGVGPGDEVIMADTNWIASAAPVVHLGACPVFVDVDPVSWCLDPKLVEAAITPRTKAILAVHIYGNLCDLEELLAIGRKHGIPVVEDAAEGLGSIYHGRRAGAVGAFGAFSFHGTKTLTTGEGGIFVTDDAELYARVLTMSNHGRRREQPRQFWADEIGFKYKMSNLQAALGCAQLERIEELIARKRAIFLAYADALAGIPGISMNPEPPGTQNGYWMPTVVCDPALGITREFFQAAFAVANIDARVFFWPLSSTPPFGSGSGAPVARQLADHGINLPSYHDLTEADIARVVATVHDLVSAAPVRLTTGVRES